MISVMSGECVFGQILGDGERTTGKVSRYDLCPGMNNISEGFWFSLTLLKGEQWRSFIASRSPQQKGINFKLSAGSWTSNSRVLVAG